MEMVETLEEAIEWDELHIRTKGMKPAEASRAAWSAVNGAPLVKGGMTQCPYCLKMYHAHSRSSGTVSEAQKHFKKGCKK